MRERERNNIYLTAVSNIYLTAVTMGTIVKPKDAGDIAHPPSILKVLIKFHTNRRMERQSDD